MADEGSVIACHTVDEWNHHFNLGKESKKLVVVDFTASWCGTCRMIAPFFDEQAKKFTNVIFLKVDVDELKAVSAEWNIRVMPTFIFFKEGLVFDTIVGNHELELYKRLMTHGQAMQSATS